MGGSGSGGGDVHATIHMIRSTHTAGNRIHTGRSGSIRYILNSPSCRGKGAPPVVFCYPLTKTSSSSITISPETPGAALTRVTSN